VGAGSKEQGCEFALALHFYTLIIYSNKQYKKSTKTKLKFVEFLQV